MTSFPTISQICMTKTQIYKYLYNYLINTRCSLVQRRVLLGIVNCLLDHHDIELLCLKVLEGVSSFVSEKTGVLVYPYQFICEYSSQSYVRM